MKTEIRIQETTNQSRGPASGARSRLWNEPPAGLTRRSPRAFTLIELLVVIAIIALLAAMVFPITGAVNRHRFRSLARTSVGQIEIALDVYKSKLGHYPPDHPGFPVPNQLYYELLGTTLDNQGFYTTKDARDRIAANTLNNLFGVAGFVNATKGGGDEGPIAQNYLKALKQTQYLSVTIPGVGATCTVLGTTMLDGPIVYLSATGNGAKINPFRYVSSNPTNNPKSYDLWIDIKIGSKTNRICNWSQDPLILP